mmetsp:Transcript_126458/g.281940  ORF Transcript_126458/g.281940 Transcript_126458/m.281940 type:complete len:382 (+) Transcript_126458:676-1821(+)
MGTDLLRSCLHHHLTRRDSADFIALHSLAFAHNGVLPLLGHPPWLGNHGIVCSLAIPTICALALAFATTIAVIIAALSLALAFAFPLTLALAALAVVLALTFPLHALAGQHRLAIPNHGDGPPALVDRAEALPHLLLEGRLPIAVAIVAVVIVAVAIVAVTIVTVAIVAVAVGVAVVVFTGATGWALGSPTLLAGNRRIASMVACALTYAFLAALLWSVTLPPVSRNIGRHAADGVFSHCANCHATVSVLQLIPTLLRVRRIDHFNELLLCSTYKHLSCKEVCYVHPTLGIHLHTHLLRAVPQDPRDLLRDLGALVVPGLQRHHLFQCLPGPHRLLRLRFTNIAICGNCAACAGLISSTSCGGLARYRCPGRHRLRFTVLR